MDIIFEVLSQILNWIFDLNFDWTVLTDEHDLPTLAGPSCLSRYLFGAIIVLACESIVQLLTCFHPFCLHLLPSHSHHIYKGSQLYRPLLSCIRFKKKKKGPMQLFQ